MKKPSDVFNSIRFAKLDPKHDKGHKGGSTDDEEHYAVGEKEWNQQVAHAKKRAMQEAKEKTEYDYEGDMARGQLQSIINNAQRVHDMLEDNDNLPEWVQSKITLAEDYISTVANYMMSEIDEEVELEEGLQQTLRKFVPGYAKKQINDKMDSGKFGKTDADKDANFHRYKKVMNKITTKEEVEQVDEGIVGNMVSKVINKLHSSNAKRPLPKASERREFEKPKTEEVEQIDELSNELLGRYKKAAGEDASKADKSGDYKKGDKRFSGIVKATKKQFDNDMKKEETTPPFDPPYKTNKGVVTDKSGAKHEPMSMARNLARQAMKKQAEKMPVKESLEESRKTDIVKEAFKKAKKKNDETFQSEPELGSSVVKADN